MSNKKTLELVEKARENLGKILSKLGIVVKPSDICIELTDMGIEISLINNIQDLAILQKALIANNIPAFYNHSSGGSNAT